MKTTSKKALISWVLGAVLGASVWLSVAQSTDGPTLYSESKTYIAPGQVVRYFEALSGGGGYRVAHFKNKWYVVAGDKPNFDTNAGAWERITPIFNHPNNAELGAISATPTQEQWSGAAVYVGGNVVQYGSACYKAKWWTQGDDPSKGNPWEASACPAVVAQSLPAVNAASSTAETIVTPSTVTTVTADVQNNCGGDGSNIPAWNNSGVYTEGMVVKNGSPAAYYKAKWWNQGNAPAPLATGANEWDSPWKALGNTCIPKDAKLPIASNETQTGVPSNVTPAPAADTTTAAANTNNTATPAVPPVIPSEVPASQPAAGAAPTSLPSEGYAFLRQVTADDWNWMFPLRSGRVVSSEPCAANQFQNCGGGSRNLSGSGLSDTFTLQKFIESVLSYNHWAKANGYKQFLNEGSAKQQAEEFVAFWAKSSRETSGSWNNAPAPWIVEHTFANGETIAAWKGGLYWVEEVGYSTKSDGTSAAIGYVDEGSAYTPENRRSYHGRGIIQLSWNYNYGAFSEWMYNNGMFTDIIKSKRELLVKPNLVADDGRLAFMSGIWFWMTPQGAKPASQDVLLGVVTNISKSTQDQGLPKTNTGYSPKVASGDTTDPEVMAYRIGTVINIVNGGLECNKAALWHGGPVQRVFYYDAYAAYFNSKYNVNIRRLPDVKASSKAAWEQKVTDGSPIQLQSATCYNQKSYYGW